MTRTFLFLLLLSLSTLSFSQTTETRYLSGTDKDHTVDWKFKIDRGRKSGEWSTIAVPSNWETQGFGVYNYGKEWRDLLPESDATGTYQYDFSVPRDWKGKVVEIVFEGSMTDTKVMVNGKQAGPIHQGSFYQFRYDISQLLRYGKENTLEVVVNNVSANESVNKAERDADFWVFGGIYRPVYLEAHPAEFIDWTAIDAQANGDFLVNVYPNQIKNANRVEAQIMTMEGEPVGETFRQDISGNQDSIVLKTKIDQLQQWSPEFPNRYQVEVRLLNGENTLHSLRETFGFRTVELREKDGFYVNGEKVRFKGVNRHSAWPTSGRTTSKAISIRDVNLMKEMNMNAVRMSHYPPDPHFLDVCDSLGLFVIDELTGWQDAYDTLVGEKLVKELVVRDVNHPSIVLWANGNEGGNNYALLDDYALYDPQQRVVIHPWNIINGTNTLHYSDYGCCAGTLFNGKEVFFPTEFLHGLYDGGHGAGLNDWWNAMLDNPLAAGGFLWVFADEGVVRTDSGGVIDTHGSNAPDGIVGPYREKEGSFYTIKEVWSPVYIEKQYITPKFDGKLRVENRYHFTDLNQCTFDWQLVNFPKPNGNSTDSSVVASSRAQVPSVAPGAVGTLALDLPNDWAQNDALYLTATDPHGRPVFTWTWPIKTPAEVAQSLVRSNSISPATAREAGNTLTLSANGVAVEINKETGLITQINNEQGALSLTNGPQLAAGEVTYQGLEHYQDGNDYVVKLQYDGIVKEMTYRMLGNGWFQLDYTYTPSGKLDYMGINFDYPEEKVKGVKWLGEGPYRVWKNRLKGTFFDVHQNDYNNTITGETEWIYPEFKGYFADLYWAVIDNEEFPFTVVSASEDIYLRLFTPEPPAEAYNENTDGKFPEGNLSFMSAISPIGTKFKAPEQVGPSGQPNQFLSRPQPDRIWGGTLYFNFGAGINELE